jgi:multidrug resistance efflux pump
MEEKDIEIRSEEVQEILGQVPGKIIRWGITVVFSVIIIMLIGSYFFKYPDIINSTIIITTENPPAAVVAHSTGKLHSVWVKDKQTVQSGQQLGIIENPSDHNHVLLIKESLESIKSKLVDPDTMLFAAFKTNLSLGSLQNSYAQFLKACNEWKNFLSLDYHRKKIVSLQEQLGQINQSYLILIRQKSLYEKDMSLTIVQYQRDSTLYAKGVIALADFEKSQSSFIQKKYAFESLNSALSSSRLQTNQTEQSVLDLKLQYQEQKRQLEQAINEAYDLLNSQIAAWELAYLLKSPIDGKITFTKFWSANQNVNAGDIIFSVVPEKPLKIIGRVQLPVQGSGKVKIGQKVNIKLANYPYMEYGMLQGFVKSISMVTAENNYMVEVTLQDSLITNYGKRIAYTRELEGSAEIITDDLRLIERFIQPIRAILKKDG